MILHQQRLETMLRVIGENPIFEPVRAPLKARLGVAPTPRTCLHEEMALRVYHYTQASEASPDDRPAVLLVPSLINGPYIMDLLPRHSLVEGLLQRGLDVYMMEWAIPDRGVADLDLTEIVDQLLPRVVRRVRRLARGGDERLTVLGQCLGGTLAGMSASRHPGLISGVVLLTSPLDFAPDCVLKHWTSSEVLYLEAVLAAYPDAVPAGLLQIAFPLLDPRALVTRYRTLYARGEKESFVRMFQALDLWTRDGRPVPARFLREVVHDLYRENRLAQGSLELDGRRVDLGAYEGPVLNLVAAHDNIVPRESALAAQRLFRKVETQVLNTGHVTTVVAHPKRAETYDRVAAFVQRVHTQGT